MSSLAKPTLVILAAGMASRYGSQKQTEGFGPNGETIMEYSIYDAIEAGFDKVVFIIRESFTEPFKANFEPKLAGKIKTEYVFQSINKFTKGFDVNEDRVKPWGTAHALLCTKFHINEPFAVINADDYYGKDAFISAYNFLVNNDDTNSYAIIGYNLNNTLSDNGTVTRGVCNTNEDGFLLNINETSFIYRNDQGNVVFKEADESEIELPLDENTLVSMNFMCFSPSFLNHCENGFNEFLTNNAKSVKAEFIIPNLVGDYIKSVPNGVKVIPTNAKWFGVTYKEDAPVVKASINKLVESGTYPNKLWK
jgi:hypothetical protein